MIYKVIGLALQYLMIVLSWELSFESRSKGWNLVSICFLVFACEVYQHLRKGWIEFFSQLRIDP